jgi:hypothetical protein
MTSQTTINAPLNAQGANTNGSRLLSIGSSGSKRPVNNGPVRLYTINGADWSKRYPLIVRTLPKQGLGSY